MFWWLYRIARNREAGSNGGLWLKTSFCFSITGYYLISFYFQ